MKVKTAANYKVFECLSRATNVPLHNTMQSNGSCFPRHVGNSIFPFSKFFYPAMHASFFKTPKCKCHMLTILRAIHSRHSKIGTEMTGL